MTTANPGSGAGLPEGFNLIKLGTVDSTNAEALRLAHAGAPANTLVWADEQTHGRGRRGKSWASPPGNLYCSTLLYPDQPPAKIGQMAFVAALALADGIAEVAPQVDVAIKWPNDLLVGGRKIAGILLEGNVSGEPRRRSLVVGMGVNVATHPEISGGLPATSLAKEGAEVSTPEVLSAAAAGLARWIGVWEAQGFDPVRTEWIGRAVGIGGEIEIHTGDDTVSGTFSTIDDLGALIVSTKTGARAIGAADVFLIGPSGQG